jgi:predicted methyltransferase
MTRKLFSGLLRQVPALVGVLCLAAPFQANAADAYEAAVAHPGRSAADLNRDSLDHPADILRLSGVKPGMRVADVLAGDGYYSELTSYVVGPKGKVFMINNAAFDHWSEGPLQARLESGRLGNVEHETLDLNHMNLAPGSLDAIFLVKVYHDLYWVDTDGASQGLWPKIDTSAVLDQLSRALKPGGVVLLVDHSAKPGTGNTVASSLHRIDENYAIKDFESRGFKVVAKSDLLRRPGDARDQVSYKGPMLGKTDRFVVVFRKRKTAA